MIFLIFLNLHVFSQYNFVNFSEEQGLSSNQATCILKDSDGFIWIGTKNGLNRFDGTEFMTFYNSPGDSSSLSENYILTLYQDKYGFIWVGTYNEGISELNTETMEFRNYTNNTYDSTSISEGFCKLIFEDDLGNLWIAVSDHGIDLFNRENKSFKNYRPTEQIDGLSPRLANSLISFAPDPQNNQIIWLGSLDGIFSFNLITKIWTHFPIVKEKANNPILYGGKENVVRDMIFDKDGYLWFGTWGGGFCKLDTLNGNFSIFKYETFFPVNGIRNNVIRIVWKNNNEFWFISYHKGIGIFNINDNSIRFLTNPLSNSISVNGATDIITDKSGFIYVSSITDGLYYTNTKAYQFNKENISHNIISLGQAKSSDIIWAGTYDKYGKLLAINKSTGNIQEYSYTPINDVGENFIINIKEGKNSRHWLIGHHNLYYIDEYKPKIQPYYNFDPNKFDINRSHIVTFVSAALDNKNRIWAGSKFHGLFCIDTEYDTIHNYFFEDSQKKKVLFESFIFSLYTDSKGRTWYVSEDFGFFDPGLNKLINYSYPGDFSNSDIKLKKIYTITETQNGNIWLGTANAGIAVIKVTDDTAFFIKSYSKSTGLQHNCIQNLVTDKSDNVWVITPLGISKINAVTDSIENYGIEYGLMDLQCIDVDSDGEIFIGTGNGYYHFYPDDIKPLKTTNKPYLKYFKIFDEHVNVNPFLKNDQPIELKYNQNFFSIEYGAINFFRQDQANFQYILEGLDKKWQNAGQRKHITYTNLGGGSYNFRLKTNNRNEIVIPIFIETPYWKTWWFYSLFIFSIILLALLAHFYRMSQLRKQEELKTLYNKKIGQLEIKALRAQMNPHFLFNSLNSIRYYILKDENENASEYITKFARLLRLILRNSRQNQISLNDELHALEIYIDFEQMRFNRKFDYKINIADNINQEDIKIQPLTIQPFVENAIWHGLMPKKENGMLKVDINKKNGKLNIIIEDNGIGREKAAQIKKNNLFEKKSYGLQITEERMSLMKSIRNKQSDFKIIDLYNDNNEPTGTKVEIRFEI